MPPPRRSSAEILVRLSVLDRLIDTDPKTQVEEPLTRAQSLRAMKTAVRRDLEWLLNTRRIAEPPDEGLEEVNKSVYIYGLPDFTALSIAAPKDQLRLLRSLQGAIRMFEARLANVQITPIKTTEVGSRTLRFRIEGMLLLEPNPEFVSFDTVLDLSSSEYVVRGDANA